MKKLITAICIPVLLFGIFACKNVDEKLVSEMKESATVLETAKPSGDSAILSVFSLKAKFANLEPEKAAIGQFVVGKMSDKVNAILNEYNKSKAELSALMADYEAGKITKEEVEPKYQALLNHINNFEKAFQRISKMTERPTEELIQIGTEMAKGEGIDPVKSAGSDAAGGATTLPASVQASDAAGSDAGATLQGNGSLQGDGTTKKKNQ